jgi:DNA primase
MSQVDEVRAAADIVKIVGDYVKLRKAGANYMGLCPFHQEKTPSFAVHPAKQIFHCFGCGVGGDVFKFVMMIDSLTFPEALRRVAEKVGVAISESFGEAAYDPNARVRAALFKMHEAAAKLFAGQLTGTAEGRMARAYLEDRGLGDEAVGRFRLGYAPGDGQTLIRHLSGAMGESAQGDSGNMSELLEKSGLVGHDAERNRYYDRFRRRVIFPIANDSGKVVAFAGRALGDEQPKYLNSPETPIYTKGRVLYHLDRAAQAIRKLDYAILVEGYMDCIAVASIGIENVVASCGTSLTEGQIRLLARYSRRIVVNYDPDSAGVAATERSLALLLEEGFEAKVLALPGKLDPDSFIRKEGSGRYRELLSSAPSYIDYLTDQAISTHNLSTPEGKVGAANAVLPYLAKVPNPMLRVELAGRLAERLRLDQRLLRDELRRVAGPARSEVRLQPGAATPKVTVAEKELLRAFVENQELADELLPQMMEQGMFEGVVTEPIFKRFLDLLRKGEKAEPSALEEPLNAEARQVLYESLFWAVEPPDRGRIDRHLQSLRARRARRQLDAVRVEIQEALQTEDLERLRELERVKLNLQNELRGLSEGAKISSH